MYFLLIAEAGNVKIFGGDKLAFKGQSVPFECQAAGWYPQPILQWQVNDRKVGTELQSHTHIHPIICILK